MNNTQTETLETWISLYLTAQRGYLATDYKTSAGYYLQMEPVKEFDYKNRSELIAALEGAFKVGNPLIEAPMEAPGGSLIMEAAGFKSASELEKNTFPVSIEKLTTCYEIRCPERLANGRWDKRTYALSRSIPLGMGCPGIADVILEYLQTRSAK